MSWQALFVQEFFADLETLRTHGADPPRLLRLLREAVEDEFKAERLDHFLRSGGPSASIDRLESSRFPRSLRMQVTHDYRATAWAYQTQRMILFTHVFHKTDDPNYKRAAEIHDRRLIDYVREMKDFLEKKRRT